LAILMKKCRKFYALGLSFNEDVVVVGRVWGVCHVVGRLLEQRIYQNLPPLPHKPQKLLQFFQLFKSIIFLCSTSSEAPDTPLNLLFCETSQTFSCLSIENAKISIKANMSLFALRPNESHSRSSPSTCKQKNRKKSFSERNFIYV
jgi:hypothetical protein